MSKRITVGLVVLLLGVIGYRVITHGEEPAMKDIDAYQEEMGTPVEVQKVQRKNLITTRNFTGTIEGERQADAIANLTQKLVALKVRVGERVKKDQVVAELDTDISGNATVKYSQARSNYEAKKKELRRMKALYEAGAVSEQTYDNAVLQNEIAREDLEAASKLVKIPAPISGLVTHVFSKDGETVITGRPVVRIAKLDTVLIEIDINESEIAGIQNGREVRVKVAAYPDKKFTGRLEDLSLSADAVSRAFTAWVRVKNPDLSLRPGMFAQVEIPVTTKENTLTIDKDAVVAEDGQNLVYVVNPDSVANVREVQIGETSGNQLEILSGLDENDMVVVLGHNKLEEGKKVNIISSGTQ